MSDWPTPDTPEHVFNVSFSDGGEALGGGLGLRSGLSDGLSDGLPDGLADGLPMGWWTSSGGVWLWVQAVGIVLVCALGLVVNVLCALIWSGRPALRSHSTRYVYNMLAANLLCACLAPLDVFVLLFPLPPPPPAAPLSAVRPTAAADLLWPGAAAVAAAAAAAATDAQVSAVAEGAAGAAVAAAALVGPDLGPDATPAAAAAADLWARPWELWVRDANRFAEALAVQVSVFSVLLVALDRHKAVLSPLHYHRMATRQRSACLIVCNWLLIPALTVLFESRLIPYSQFVHFSIGFVVPLSIIVYMYIQMSLAAHQNSKRTRRHSVCTANNNNSSGGGGGAPTGQQMSLDAGSGSRGGSRGGSLDLSLPPFTGTPELANKGDLPRRPGRNPPLGSIVLNSRRRCSNASFSTLLLREEGRAVKTAVFVVGAYLACWTPYFVFVAMRQPSPPCVLLLAHVNACVSPWIYVLRNEEVRLEAKKLVARVLHLKLASMRQPQDSPGHSYGRSASYYSKSLEASSHPGHPLRHQSSHCDSMSVQSFHLPSSGGVAGDLANPLGPLPMPLGAVASVPGYHHGAVAAAAAAAGTDTPLTADSLCSAGESPGPMTGGGLVRLAYKYPSQYTAAAGGVHLQRGRSQTCVRQNSDSSSGSGRPLLQSDQLQQQGQGRGGRERRRLGSSGDSGSDHGGNLDDDPSPPPPLTPPDRACRRKLLHRDSLEEEDEDQLSPTYAQPAPVQPPALAAALRRLSAQGHHGHPGPPPTPPRRSSLCGVSGGGSASARRGSLKLDGNIFQFENIPVSVALSSLRPSAADLPAEPPPEPPRPPGHAAGAAGSECSLMLTATSVLRPPPPPRNKLKRIEAVEESVCDTTFSTCSNGYGHVPGHEQQQPFQLWAMDEFPGRAAARSGAAGAAAAAVHLHQPQQCGRAVAANKMSDIGSFVKTSLHRPAFRIPKADF